MPKKTLTTFTVSGHYPFPMDMLRHDCAYPASSEDAGRIAASLDPTSPFYRSLQDVTLRAPYGRVTHGRWQSFGWVVTNEVREG